MAYSKKLILFCGMFFFAFFVSEGGGASEKKVSKIEKVSFAAGQINNMNTLHIELGVKEGIYQREGIDLEFLLMRGPIVMVGLRSGTLDYGYPGGEAIRAAAMGIPIRVVMVNRARSGVVLVGRPGINSVKDLKGKVIGVPTLGSAPEQAAMAIVRYHGLDPQRDVVFRAVGPGGIMYTALKAGTIDAAITNILHSARLVHEEKRGFVELMVADEVFKGVTNAIGVSSRKIKENPNQIKKVIRATFRSISFVKENRKEVIDHMVKEWGLGKELASILYDREKDGYTRDGMIPDELFQTEIKRAQELGFLPANLKVPTSQLRDFTLLEGVLKELGIK